MKMVWNYGIKFYNVTSKTIWPKRVKKFPLIFRVTDRVGINESGFLTIVRLGRVLRPLRAINRVPSMSILDLSYVFANHILHINNKAMKVRGKSLQRKMRVMRMPEYEFSLTLISVRERKFGWKKTRILP